MRATSVLLAAALIVASSSCGKSDWKEGIVPKTERVRLVIDENELASKDAFAIIEPVWWTANIYGSYDDYESSLARFSRAQRMIFAMEWYMAEVNNGGHDQFYFNSTGIVWEDALKGFAEIGVPEVSAIITESAQRLGGRPSFDREQRIRAVELRKPKFGDLDERFYTTKVNIGAKMLEYIRARPTEFFFDGEIERPKLQNLGAP